MTHLVNNLLPDDVAATNSGEQQALQRDYNSFTHLDLTEDPFTQDELDVLIAELKRNRATGTDGIKGSIVKVAHQHIGAAVLQIYNACWKLSYFSRF
jgi:hypothetical protein